MPVKMSEEARTSLDARQSKPDVCHLELHPDDDKHGDVGADVSESTGEVRASL